MTDYIEKFLKEKRTSLQQERLKLENENTSKFNELILNDENNNSSDIYNNNNSKIGSLSTLIKDKNEKNPSLPSSNKVKINNIKEFSLDDDADDDIAKLNINNKQNNNVVNRLRKKESDILVPSLRTIPIHKLLESQNNSEAPVKFTHEPATNIGLSCVVSI